MTRIHRKNLCSAQENTVVIRHDYKDYRRGSYSGQRNDAYKNEHNNCGKKKHAGLQEMLMKGLNM